MSIPPTPRENYLRTCAALEKSGIDLADGVWHHVQIQNGKIFIDGRQHGKVNVKDCDRWLRFTPETELGDKWQKKYGEDFGGAYGLMWGLIFASILWGALLAGLILK